MIKTSLIIGIVGRLKCNLQGIKHRLQRWRWYRPLHLAYTGWRAYHGGLPDWETLLKSNYSIWRDFVRRSTGRSGRILIATGAGGHLPSMKIYPTREEAKSEIFYYIEVFDNRTRRHSHLNQMSPMAFEQLPTGS